MDMGSLMEQARLLQDKVASAQDLLAKTSVKGIAGNGAVIVDMTGKYDLINLSISPEFLTQDPEIVIETITAAFKDAKLKADTTIDRVMADATAGMPIPE